MTENSNDETYTPYKFLLTDTQGLSKRIFKAFAKDSRLIQYFQKLTQSGGCNFSDFFDLIDTKIYGILQKILWDIMTVIKYLENTRILFKKLLQKLLVKKEGFSTFLGH